MKKRIVSLVLALAMLAALGVTSFAQTNPNSKISSISGNPSTHVFTFTTNYTNITDNQMRLNALTEYVPSSGTNVTTWVKTEVNSSNASVQEAGSPTQQWGYIAGYSDGNPGANIIASVANPNVCLNINRSYSEPLLNLWAVIDNRFGDVNIVESNNSMYVEPRHLHSSNMYLSLGNLLPYASSGGGRYIHWRANSSSRFYRYDISWGEYS